MCDCIILLQFVAKQKQKPEICTKRNRSQEKSQRNKPKYMSKQTDRQNRKIEKKSTSKQTNNIETNLLQVVVVVVESFHYPHRCQQLTSELMTNCGCRIKFDYNI
jgi:hypothetical protein